MLSNLIHSTRRARHHNTLSFIGFILRHLNQPSSVLVNNSISLDTQWCGKSYVRHGSIWRGRTSLIWFDIKQLFRVFMRSKQVENPRFVDESAAILQNDVMIESQFVLPRQVGKTDSEVSTPSNISPFLRTAAGWRCCICQSYGRTCDLGEPFSGCEPNSTHWLYPTTDTEPRLNYLQVQAGESCNENPCSNCLSQSESCHQSPHFSFGSFNGFRQPGEGCDV